MCSTQLRFASFEKCPFPRCSENSGAYQRLSKCAEWNLVLEHLQSLSIVVLKSSENTNNYPKVVHAHKQYSIFGSFVECILNELFEHRFQPDGLQFEQLRDFGEWLQECVYTIYKSQVGLNTYTYLPVTKFIALCVKDNLLSDIRNLVQYDGTHIRSMKQVRDVVATDDDIPTYINNIQAFLDNESFRVALHTKRPKLRKETLDQISKTYEAVMNAQQILFDVDGIQVSMLFKQFKQFVDEIKCTSQDEKAIYLINSEYRGIVKKMSRIQHLLHSSTDPKCLNMVYNEFPKQLFETLQNYVKTVRMNYTTVLHGISGSDFIFKSKDNNWTCVDIKVSKNEMPYIDDIFQVIRYSVSMPPDIDNISHVCLYNPMNGLQVNINLDKEWKRQFETLCMKCRSM